MAYRHTSASLLAAIALLLATFATGCVTNNGDIGNLYGLWKLEKLVVDDKEVAQPEADGSYTTWLFQNDIIEIVHTTPRHDMIARNGTWARPSDKVMTFDFTHGDDTYAPGTDLYRAPEWISFPEGKSTFDVITDDGKRLILQYAEAGRTVRYTLVKDW